MVRVERRATLEEIVRVAEKINITKLPDDLINKVAESKKFEDIPKDIQSFIITAGGLLRMAREGKEKLTEEEFVEAINDFYIDILLEYNVRKGYLVRIGNWSYKTMQECKYKLTEKGEKEGERILRELINEDNEKVRYIG
jgi:hypothetical protein